MKIIIAFLLLTGLTGPIGICQQGDKKMPITTSSDKARELYIQGRDLKENVEEVPGDKLLRQAIELDPYFALAHVMLGTREDTDKALALIKNVTPPEACMIRCQDAALKGELKLAAMYADSLAEQFPKDKNIQWYAGFIHYASDPEKGAKFYGKALDLDPDYAAAHNALGYYYMETGKNVKAAKEFDKYLELKPGSANAHDSYADFLGSNGKHTSAVEEYRKAYQSEPSFYNSMVKAGWMYIRDGKYDLAREVFDQFRRMAANDDDQLLALLLRSLASYVKEDMNQAFADLDILKNRATELKSGWNILNASWYKGMFTLESGDPAGALKFFDEAARLIPHAGLDTSGISAATMFTHGYKTMALALSGKPEEAHQELMLARTIYNSRINSNAETNAMCLAQGVYEISRKNYEKAIDLMEPRSILTGSVSNQYYTGVAFEKSGDVGKAIEYYTKAMNSTNGTFTAFYFNKSKKKIRELSRFQ